MPDLLQAGLLSAQLSMGLLQELLPVSLWLLRHTPPQCKSRSSWWSGSAGGAFTLKRAVNQCGPHRNYRVGSWRGVRNSFYENAKHDLIKETHCGKMKKCQFALKQNRSMNILTIWQKTFPYKCTKLARKFDKNSTQQSLCPSKNFEEIQRQVLVTGLLQQPIPFVPCNCLCFTFNQTVLSYNRACNTIGGRLK